jgi:heavy metal efflux system protein
MDLRGIPANLLSLGAIDFGIIVDGAVIMTENIVRHLSERKVTEHRVGREVQHAAVEVARPLTFAVLIIMTVYVPIVTFQRIEGKLFRPMAVTISLAVVGSLLLTLTLIPVLTSFLFRRPPSERESPLLRWLRRPYTPAISWCVRRPLVPILGAAGLLALSLFVFTLLGKEFLPELDEGDLWLRVKLPIGIALEATRPYVHEIRERMLQFPEVRVVVSQTGAPDDGTDPNGADNNEFYIGLKPREAWRFKEKDKLQFARRTLTACPSARPSFADARSASDRSWCPRGGRSRVPARRPVPWHRVGDPAAARPRGNRRPHLVDSSDPLGAAGRILALGKTSGDHRAWEIRTRVSAVSRRRRLTLARVAGSAW